MPKVEAKELVRTFVQSLILLFVAAAPAWPQGDSEDLCKKYESVTLPAEAVVLTPAEYPACESYKSYAGIGRPIDYAAARTCAWQERAAQKAELRQNPAAPVAWVVGGSLILADLYANGDGDRQNLPLAERLACELSGGLVREAFGNLDARETAARNAKPFEVCDYAATTFEMNFCAGYSLEANDARRNETLDRISKNWAANQKEAFQAARTAFEEYAADVSKHETYRGGTIRTVRMIGVEEDLHAKFVADFESYEKGNFHPVQLPATRMPTKS